MTRSLQKERVEKRAEGVDPRENWKKDESNVEQRERSGAKIERKD